MSCRQALLLSSSRCHGYTLLQFAKEEICAILQKHNARELVFVPYAQNDFDAYTAKINEVIGMWGFTVKGIHTYSDPITAVNSAKAIFVGGGNTFLLLSRLYENNLVETIRKRVFEDGMVYIGSSAGTNVATKSIHTTNDMPIIYPPSFDAIGIVPFNINPHYIDVPQLSNHMGETRDERIKEYLQMPYADFVLGLCEGAILHIDGNNLKLKGVSGAVLFKRHEKKVFPVGEDISFLLDYCKDII